MDKKITICCDFDGVIRDHKTGKPVEGALTAIRWLESKGRNVVICTAREDLDNVNEWLKKYDFNKTATNIKPRATCYVDDRAIRFVSWDDITSFY
jgi:hydroxymethylpyrimidine pyrophosphatase-like HAD family hydrolase